MDVVFQSKEMMKKTMAEVLKWWMATEGNKKLS